jgi:hypothetical protein
MSKELFDVVFKGECIKGLDPALVKQSIGRLFKMEGAKLDAMFSQREIVLKRNLEFDTANKYRVAIKKAGARVDLVEKKEAAATSALPAIASASSAKAVFGERAASFKTSSPEQTKSAAEPVASPPSHAEKINVAVSVSGGEDGISLAPPCTPVLREDERAHVAAVHVDVSGLSIKGGDGDLLNVDEKRLYKTLDIDLSAIGLAPSGENLLREGERPKVKPVDVDISGLNIAAPGATLGQPKPPPPSPPDVSNIHLVD